MYINNQILSLVYKAAAFILCAVGLYLNSGLPGGAFDPAMFLYFTIQSNCLCLAYFAFAVLDCAGRIKRDGPAAGDVATRIKPGLKGAVVLAITITMLVYWFILVGAGALTIEGLNPTANAIVHLVVPLLTIGDWLLFDRKGALSPLDPPRWLAIPFVYFLFALLAARLGARYSESQSRYPSFFIDADLLGWGRVLLNALGLALGFLLLGYGIFALDRLLGVFRRSGRGRSA